MRTALIFFFCGFVTAAPTFGKSASDVTQRQDLSDDGGLFRAVSSGTLKSRANLKDDSSDNDNVGNVLDCSRLEADSNGDNISIADLSGALRRGLSVLLRRASSGSRVPVPGVSNKPSAGESTNGIGDNETIGNFPNGSAPGIIGNGINVSAAKLRRRRLLRGLESGSNSGSSVSSSKGANDSGNDSVVKILDGDKIGFNKNLQNITVLRRNHGHDDGSDNSLSAKQNGGHSSIAENGQNLTIVLHRATAPAVASAASAASVATPTPSSAGPQSEPTQTDNDNGNDNNESIADILDGSGISLDKNLQAITVLKKRAPSPGTTGDSSNSDYDKSIGDILDKSGLDVNQNLQNVEIADL